MFYDNVQEEAVIHFEDDIEELQQWDHQVRSFSLAAMFFLCGIMTEKWKLCADIWIMPSSQRYSGWDGEERPTCSCLIHYKL